TENPLLAKGDTGLHDRGINDGETISCLKRDLGVDVTFGLREVAEALLEVEPEAKERPRGTIRRLQEYADGELVGLGEAGIAARLYFIRRYGHATLANIMGSSAWHPGFIFAYPGVECRISGDVD